MAGAGIEIRIDGEEALERQLAALHAKARDLTPLMDTIGTFLVVDAEDNFEGEHGPDGIPWKPSRRVLEHGGKTLQRTPPRLRPSITHIAGPTSVQVGTNVIYAARHQYGFTGTEKVGAHRRRMTQAFGLRLSTPREVMVGEFTRKASTPARPFLGWSTHIREDIADAVANYVGADQ